MACCWKKAFLREVLKMSLHSSSSTSFRNTYVNVCQPWIWVHICCHSYQEEYQIKKCVFWMNGAKLTAGKPTLVNTEHTNSRHRWDATMYCIIKVHDGVFMMEHPCRVLTCWLGFALDVNTPFERLGNKATASKWWPLPRLEQAVLPLSTCVISTLGCQHSTEL